MYEGVIPEHNLIYFTALWWKLDFCIFFLYKNNKLLIILLSQKKVVGHVWSLPLIYIFALKRCLELGVLLWYQLEQQYSLPKKIWVWLPQGIWDLSKVNLPELLERVYAGKVQEADSNLSICINFTGFLFVVGYNIKNVGGLDVLLLFMTLTSTFDTPNSRYLKIYGFIWYNFGCFGEKEQPNRSSVFHKQKR